MRFCLRKAGEAALFKAFFIATIYYGREGTEETYMNITLKNGDVLKLEENATCMQAAQAISEGLARNAVCARVNGELTDLSHTLKEGDALEIVTLKDRDGLHVYRHTCAHVLAQALKTIYPLKRYKINFIIKKRLIK